jgi:prolycopene isomerase
MSIKGLKKDEYDVIIIGAGIGGLVCGCYLAKAGKKVLIVEKNDKTGGYCTSFERNGFKFDACVHSLGSCREGGVLSGVLDDLKALSKIQIMKYSPSDTVLSTDLVVNFSRDLDETIQDFVDNFPKESKAISTFFHHIAKPNFAFLLTKSKRQTFKSVLDEYFVDERLKSILSIPLLGNAGLPASLISVGIAAMVYRELMFDGGYYPKGGMETIPKILTEQFLSFGGTMLLSSLVNEIKVKRNKIQGVVINKDFSLKSNYVISNCDMNLTIKKLLNNSRKLNLLRNNRKLEPSLSAFSIYLSLNANLKKRSGFGANLWILPDYDIENTYRMVSKGNIDREEVHVLCFFPSVHDKQMAPNGKESICLFINAPFKSDIFWKANSRQKAERIVKKVKDRLPILKEADIKEISNPITLYNYTFNYKGAAYGWASYPSRNRSYNWGENKVVSGLFFVGNWNGQGHGIPAMSYLGKSLSRIIIQRKETS